MAHYEHVHERISEPFSAEYVDKRKADGWNLVGVVWERQIGEGEPEPEIDVPFGLRVADDCHHLTQDSTEKEALLLMLEMIVQDRRVTDVALELNRRGYQTAMHPLGSFSRQHIRIRMVCQETRRGGRRKSYF